MTGTANFQSKRIEMYATIRSSETMIAKIADLRI